MFPVHCKLNEFDLDKFIASNLIFSAKLHISDECPIATVRNNIASFDNDVASCKHQLDNGETLFFFYHERFSLNDDVVMCVDGEIKVDGEMNPIEDYNYGFVVQLTSDAGEQYITISPAVFNDADGKFHQNDTVHKIGWCEMFDWRMQQFIKTFKADYPSTVYAAAGI